MTIRPLRDKPNVWTHQGFLLSEDEAMKVYLSDITVPGRDETDPEVPVGVWFRWPEGERQIKYPFITIDLIAANPAFELFHSDHREPAAELYRPSVSPSLPAPPGGWEAQSYNIRNFLPFVLTYQVSVHARSARHDRYLHSIFLSDVFPVRPFWVWNPTDETWRRTELMQHVAQPTSETSESGTKRVFRRIYTVTMLAEVPQDRILDSYVYRTLRVLIPVVDRDWFDRYRGEILEGQLTPLDTFTDAERQAMGEYTVVVHEGEEVPTPT
jgi:hypothetical protein